MKGENVKDFELKEKAQKNKKTRLRLEKRTIPEISQAWMEKAAFDPMDDEGIVAISAR